MIRFFGPLLAINAAIGVVTGLVRESAGGKTRTGASGPTAA
jgi:hypothetical protein